MIEVLVVDLGGVAARFTPQRWLNALALATGLASGEIHRRVWESGFETRAELGAFDRETTIAGLTRLLDWRDDVDALIGCWAQAFKPDRAVMRALLKSSARKALFTNNGPMIDACLDGPLAGLRRIFDATICSWQVGARKPAEAAFDRAVTRLRTAPARLRLLDDDPSNVISARRRVWKAACTSGASHVIEALARFDILKRGQR